MKKPFDKIINPILLFQQWLDEAAQSEINDPGAMCLASATPEGKPSARMVLLKGVDESGFKFHTNTDSQKGLEIAANAQVALCFHWKSLRKQVRVEGIIQVIDAAEADTYFASRPYKRQIGAWASKQSRVLESREDLETRIAEFEEKFKGGDVPRPDDWAGYRIVPKTIEFWQDNPDRLHDRFVFTRGGDGTWGETVRLYP